MNETWSRVLLVTVTASLHKYMHNEFGERSYACEIKETNDI